MALVYPYEPKNLVGGIKSVNGSMNFSRISLLKEKPEKPIINCRLVVSLPISVLIREHYEFPNSLRIFNQQTILRGFDPYLSVSFI